MKKKQIIRMNENQLRHIVNESVKRILENTDDEDNNTSVERMEPENARKEKSFDEELKEMKAVITWASKLENLHDELDELKREYGLDDEGWSEANEYFDALIGVLDWICADLRRKNRVQFYFPEDDKVIFR